jgi:hypothetical protein
MELHEYECEFKFLDSWIQWTDLSYRALAPVGIQELNAAQVVHQGLLESHQHTREPLEKFLFCSISSLPNFAPPRSFFQGYGTIPAQTCPAKGRTENNTHIL